ncbi:MAG: prepilin-type N-terminal cleavage/methylation domain-containing protein [Candidatus Acidiferrales bacterium]
MQTIAGRKSKQGFSLLETMMAIVVLSFGVLTLAGVLATGLAFMGMSQADFIAQQKASEAVESIFTARDSSALTWAQILNVPDGGIFTAGPISLFQPGPDGIVGTLDDVAPIDCIVGPGPDGILGTADDTCAPLQGYTRTIAITTNVNGDTSLRQITVTINYPAGKFVRQYQLITFISQSF